MTKVKVECWSNEKGRDLLCLCDGEVSGAEIHSCHPKWKKDYCDKDKRCHCFFPNGDYFSNIKLAKLLHKSVSKLTIKDRYEKLIKFEEKAYRQCKKIVVTVKY